jgi:hypothetical protein
LREPFLRDLLILSIFLPPAGNFPKKRLLSKQGSHVENPGTSGRGVMSWNFPKTHVAVWLGLGLLAGLMVAGFWPSVPLHAVATDKVDTFSMATGPCDADVEAVYFLDHLTGELHAYVLGRTANGGAGVLCHYYRSVADDFKANGEKAKYLMVTGMDDLARMGRAGAMQPSRAVVYVAELSSGSAIAYYMPYNATAHRSGQFTQGQLMPVCPAFLIRKPLGETTKPTGRGKAAREE